MNFLELPAPTEVSDLVQEAVVWNGEVFEMHFSWTTPIGKSFKTSILYKQGSPSCS